jgi:triosephosphate isomerase
MIKGVGADYCIIGHSERRALGETNEIVGRKVRAALRNGLKVILCVGEHERDESGRYLEFLKTELEESLAQAGRKILSQIIIAYEPIWAIGKSADQSMAPRDVHETSLFIRKILREIFKNESALKIPILYGGSVAPENTEALVRGGNVEGLLVGHKSLVPEHFNEIIRILDSL